MATIKAYTDISQSKTLSKILPLESADMCYINGDSGKIIIGEWGNNVHDEDDIPCWSLAALLRVLTNPSLHKTLIGWRCDSYNENCTKFQLGGMADNPVDACVDMVEKLHELKML